MPRSVVHLRGVPPGGEQPDDQLPPPLQQGTDQPDGAQRKGIFQPDAHKRAVGVFCCKQIPRNGGKLHGMYTEDIQRAASDGLKKAHQRVPVPVQPQKQPDEQQAGKAVQQDADGA